MGFHDVHWEHHHHVSQWYRGEHGHNMHTTRSNTTRLTAGSPADSAGLREGDQIIRFGTVTRSVCVQSIAPVGRVVREQEGGRVEVVVRRRQAPGSSTTLILSPCQWDGRGLLGCHLERIP